MSNTKPIRVGLINQTDDPQVLKAFARLNNRGENIPVKVANIHRVIANSPPVVETYVAFADSLRNETKLNPDERELAILCVLEQHGGDYEIAAHRRVAAAYNLTEEQILNVSDPNCSNLYTERQNAILSFARSLAGFADDNPAAIRAIFDDRQIVELGLTLGIYIGLAYFTAAVEVPID